MKKTLRKILPVLALVLVVAVASVGGTIAWLKTATEPVVNTFTVGDINIDLTETEGKQTDGSYKFKMVPGNTISKNPKVTVKAGSEACWLFVQVTESSNLSSFIEYSVYYRKVSAVTADTDFYVLTNNQVTVKTAVTKDMMEGLKAAGATQPTLTFKAYAVQSDNVADAATAWNIAISTTTSGN